jgi:hypothetical protein
MIVEIKWRRIRGESDLAWDWTRVLYAYLDHLAKEILYIGKADGITVRQRWTRSSKVAFWDALERERGIKKHVVLVGDVAIESGRRLSRELLADVESLLIKRVQPWGNIMNRESRISRPGLRVVCVGGWSGWSSEYQDR